MAKSTRKAIPAQVALVVLAKSGRRCTLCFGLDGDVAEKRGQIAHLDGDPANSSEPNLAWMCLDHHSEFDSKTKQHKNYIISEVKAYRKNLYDLVARGGHLARYPLRGGTDGKVADSETLKNVIALFSKTGSIEFTRGRNFECPFHLNRLDGFAQFLHLAGPEHEFINPELERLRKDFFNACAEQSELIAKHTFPMSRGELQSMRTEWADTHPKSYFKAVSEVHRASNLVCKTYDLLIRTGRRKLLP